MLVTPIFVENSITVGGEYISLTDSEGNCAENITIMNFNTSNSLLVRLNDSGVPGTELMYIPPRTLGYGYHVLRMKGFKASRIWLRTSFGTIYAWIAAL